MTQSNAQQYKDKQQTPQKPVLSTPNNRSTTEQPPYNGQQPKQPGGLTPLSMNIGKLFIAC